MMVKITATSLAVQSPILTASPEFCPDEEGHHLTLEAPKVKVEWSYSHPEVDMKAHSMVAPRPKVKCEWKYYRHKPHGKET